MTEPADEACGARGPERAAPDPEQAERRAERLKERIYVTFAALATTLALQADVDHLGAGEAALTLTLAVAGTLLAVLVADLVSHVVVHEALPDASESRHMLAVVAGALPVLVLPLAFLGLSGLGVLPLAAAIGAALAVLVATLVVVGFLAVRRVRLPFGQRLLVLLAEAGLGLAVVGLEVLAH